MKALKLIIKCVCLLSTLSFISSCGTLNKKMTSSEYHNYLREDTVICELPTFEVDSLFKSILDVGIKALEDCQVCKEEPHPFVFEVDEMLEGDVLNYTIRFNTSPKMVQAHYLGAFNYEGFTFTILKRSESESSFVNDDKKEPTKLYFCDRIHTTKCSLIIKCKKNNENCEITNIDCQEAEITIIK